MTNPSHTKDFKEAAEKYAESLFKSPLPVDFLFGVQVGMEHGYAEAMKEQRWIPVSERLPDGQERYLCYVETIEDLGTSHEQVNCSYSQRHGFMENLKPMNVTHWMPLPSPPSFTEQEQSKHNTNGE